MGTDRQAIFSSIYEHNSWNGDQGVGAGPGSMPGSTAHIAEVLPEWCELLAVRWVVDAGCGDGMWQPPLPGYFGIDVVPDVIARCQAQFPWRRFLVADFVTDRLPPCDAILCRDALQHLSYDDCLGALANFKRTGAHYLFASSHSQHANADITTGDWFPINLEEYPFELGIPLLLAPDDRWEGGPHPWPDKVFGAWRI